MRYPGETVQRLFEIKKDLVGKMRDRIRPFLVAKE